MWQLLFDYNILLSIFIHLLYTDILVKCCILIPLSVILYYYSTPKELKERGIYTYKIFNHKINLFLITFYISIYLVFILYIRLSFYNSYWIFVEYGISLIRIDPIDIDPRKWSYGIVFDTRTPYSYYKALYLKQSNHRIKALIISCYIQNQLDPNIMQLLTGYLDEFNKREIFIAHNIIFTLR